jgi:hypothetical protein
MILNIFCPYLAIGLALFSFGQFFTFLSLLVFLSMGFCHWYGFNLGLSAGAVCSSEFNSGKLTNLVDEKLEKSGFDISEMSEKEVEKEVRNLLLNDVELKQLMKENNIRYEKESKVED